MTTYTNIRSEHRFSRAAPAAAGRSDKNYNRGKYHPLKIRITQFLPNNLTERLRLWYNRIVQAQGPGAVVRRTKTQESGGRG